MSRAPKLVELGRINYLIVLLFVTLYYSFTNKMWNLARLQKLSVYHSQRRSLMAQFTVQNAKNTIVHLCMCSAMFIMFIRQIMLAAVCKVQEVNK